MQFFNLIQFISFFKCLNNKTILFNQVKKIKSEISIEWVNFYRWEFHDLIIFLIDRWRDSYKMWYLLSVKLQNCIITKHWDLSAMSTDRSLVSLISCIVQFHFIDDHRLVYTFACEQFFFANPRVFNQLKYIFKQQNG